MADSLVVKTEKQEPSWIRYIKGRIQKNKNFLGFISGPTGSGKSYSGLSICKMVDPDFTTSRVVFSLEELMVLINSGTLKKGSAILLEEAGVWVSSRTWQSETNRVINYLLQTFRHRNFVLIFNSPYMDFIDAATRKLFHAEFETLRIDYEREKVILKPSLIQYNSRRQKFYYKFLRLAIKGQGVFPIKTWGVPKPPKKLTEEYEDIKLKFTQGLNRDILESLKIKRIRKESQTKRLTEKQERAVNLMGKYGDAHKVAEEMGVHFTAVYNHLKLARNKGYEPEKPTKQS